jgi:hypothetical protein
VTEAGVRKDGARAVLFIGARGRKRPKASWRRRGMPQWRWGRTAPGTRPLGQAVSTVSGGGGAVPNFTGAGVMARIRGGV